MKTVAGRPGLAAYHAMLTSFLGIPALMT